MVPEDVTPSHLALRRAILPVNPLDWMVREVGSHRFAESREKRLFPEACEESKAFELVLDRIFHLSEAQFNRGGVQAPV